jgi:tryptophan synthase beta chain
MSDKQNTIQSPEDGFYGNYGGAFIPEMLHPNVEELANKYQAILASPDFKAEFAHELKHYVGRETPLYFAERYSAFLGCSLYLKREDLNHTGAHKINNAIGQILIARRLGKKRIIAETGAGQHGVATATVCAKYGMECVVYMGEVDIKRQAPNVARMKMLGAEVRPALSGSRTLKDATNEALRDWINNPGTTHYLIGSAVGPHPFPDLVTQLQSIIGREAKRQFEEQVGGLPEAVVACVGGGSNAAGMFHDFLQTEVDLFGVEAYGKGLATEEHAASIQKGSDGVFHGALTRLIQTQDGQVIEPYSISAGLDYPGIGPGHAHWATSGRVTFLGATDTEALKSAYELAQFEGILPALESAHAVAALKNPLFHGKKVLLCLSGRGDKDLETYLSHFDTCS